MAYSIDEIKKMNIKDLAPLASQMRQDIIDNIKETGGHLSSNLGIVELTIALHYVFDSPFDKFFFDVSHQVYPHKILTNRLDKFPSLRKFKGLSGFLSKSESIHDVYEAGHSSTSISSALGYLEKKEVDPNFCGEVVAIIGDASIVNGLAMEALNYLSSKPKQKMIIILNDNEMGISKNIGGMANTFNHIRIKGKFKLLRKIMSRSVKMMMKSLAYKNNLFSGLGLKYIGIIDGHNIKDLVESFKYAKKCPSTVIIHVKTKKGKGLKYAEEDKTGIWHSTPPFNPTTGIQKVNQNEYLFGQVLCERLIELAKTKPNIRVITPGMGFGSGIDSFGLAYPDKYIDVGIAEENAVTMASTFGEVGLIPVVFIYSTFLQRAYDQLIHDISRNNAHAIICVDRAGIVDGDGPTHQGIFDVAFLSTIPNIKIFTPSTAEDSQKMLDYAINNQGCYIIRYPKSTMYRDSLAIDITKWEIIKKSLNHKYIISYGPNVHNLNDLLLQSGIGLINALMIKPFDKELIKSLVKENNKLFFFEEVCSNNTIGSQVIVYLNELKNNHEIDNYEVYLKSLPDSFLEIGSKDDLLNEYGLNMKQFIKYVEDI